MRNAPWFDVATRTGRFLRTLASSLVLFGSATIYSLGVVPLILAFEDASTLGLWILLSQTGVWFGALDLGLTASSVRSFVGPLTQGNIPALKQKFQPVLVLSLFQGLVICLLGFSGPLVGGILSIPQNLKSIFDQLFFIQCVFLGISFLSRPFASILLSAQRFEINYLGNALSFILSLGIAWFGLSQGWGLWSLLAGGILQHIVTIVLSLYGVCAMGIFNELLGGYRFSKDSFRKVISDSLSFAISPLAIMAGGFLQTAFLTRFFGLETLAAWNVGTKATTVLGQILSKFFESAFSGLSELFEVGRRDQMLKRFGQVLGWSMVMCSAFILVLYLFNDPFIRLWTGGGVVWPVWGTWAAGFMLLLSTLHRGVSSVVAVLMLWGPIRLSPILDLVILSLSLFAAFYLGGFASFVTAAVLGPFLGGLILNLRALRRAAGCPLWVMIPKTARVSFLVLVFGSCLVALGRSVF